jgi:hypothetical protein
MSKSMEQINAEVKSAEDQLAALKDEQVKIEHAEMLGRTYKEPGGATFKLASILIKEGKPYAYGCFTKWDDLSLPELKSMWSECPPEE